MMCGAHCPRFLLRERKLRIENKLLRETNCKSNFVQFGRRVSVDSRHADRHGLYSIVEKLVFAIV